LAGETVVRWSKETGYGANDGVTTDFRNSNTYKNIAAEIASSGGGGSAAKTNSGSVIGGRAPTANGGGVVSSTGDYVSSVAGKLGISTSIVWLMVGIITVGLIFKR